jgi:hypothetical protein
MQVMLDDTLLFYQSFIKELLSDMDKLETSIQNNHPLVTLFKSRFQEKYGKVFYGAVMKTISQAIKNQHESEVIPFAISGEDIASALKVLFLSEKPLAVQLRERLIAQYPDVVEAVEHIINNQEALIDAISNYSSQRKEILKKYRALVPAKRLQELDECHSPAMAMQSDLSTFAMVLERIQGQIPLEALQNYQKEVPQVRHRQLITLFEKYLAHLGTFKLSPVITYAEKSDKARKYEIAATALAILKGDFTYNNGPKQGSIQPTAHLDDPRYEDIANKSPEEKLVLCKEYLNQKPVAGEEATHLTMLGKNLTSGVLSIFRKIVFTLKMLDKDYRAEVRRNQHINLGLYGIFSTKSEGAILGAQVDQLLHSPMPATPLA